MVLEMLLVLIGLQKFGIKIRNWSPASISVRTCKQEANRKPFVFVDKKL